MNADCNDRIGVGPADRAAGLPARIGAQYLERPFADPDPR